MRFTRRRFLQLLGGAGGAAALLKGRLPSIGEAAGSVDRWATPEEVLVPSICQQCPGGCGLLVRTLDGEVAGLSGNPLHPINLLLGGILYPFCEVSNGPVYRGTVTLLFLVF